MAGQAVTKEFMLATATVMIGPQANLFSLTKSDSVGLVKNFKVSTEPTYTDLTQGVKNNIVDSQMTDNPVRASMEVYEYTTKNMLYALGLDGSTVAAATAADPIKTAITGDATAAVVMVTGDVTAKYPTPGAWVQVQEGDVVHLALLVSAVFATDTTITLSRPFPVGTDFTVAANVYPVRVVDAGSKANQPVLCAKVVAEMPNVSGETITLLIPSLRVTKGFDLSFTTDYGNMPWEFTIFEPVSTDPFYADIKVPVKLFKR